MNPAAHYARALFALTQNPSTTTAIAKQYFHNLVLVLERRGHKKLLPRVLSEYQKLVLQKERSARYAEVGPEQERTRILLELYRKLIRA